MAARLGGQPVVRPTDALPATAAEEVRAVAEPWDAALPAEDGAQREDAAAEAQSALRDVLPEAHSRGTAGAVRTEFVLDAARSAKAGLLVLQDGRAR